MLTVAKAVCFQNNIADVYYDIGGKRINGFNPLV
jgi:hypothetical protein